MNSVAQVDTHAAKARPKVDLSSLPSGLAKSGANKSELWWSDLASDVRVADLLFATAELNLKNYPENIPERTGGLPDTHFKSNC